MSDDLIASLRAARNPHCQQAADRIEAQAARIVELEAALHGAWTPIGERLPSHNSKVLVWRCGTFRRLVPGRTKVRFTGDGPRWDADLDNWPLPAALVCRITHWMPLPSAPEPKP